MEQLHYNLLYRWFVGLGVDDPVWVPTVFTKNRNRLLDAEVARKFLAELLNHKEVRATWRDASVALVVLSGLVLLVHSFAALHESEVDAVDGSSTGT